MTYITVSRLVKPFGSQLPDDNEASSVVVQNDLVGPQSTHAAVFAAVSCLRVLLPCLLTPAMKTTQPHRKSSRPWCLKLVAVTLTVVCVTSVSVYSAVFAFMSTGASSSAHRGSGNFAGGDSHVARLYAQQQSGPRGSFPRRNLNFPQESGWARPNGIPYSNNALSRSEFNRRLVHYREPSKIKRAGLAVFGVRQPQAVVNDHCSDCLHFSMPPVPEKIRGICGDAKNTKLNLVVIVASEASGFEERRILRETWLIPKARKLSHRVRHLFLVGEASNVSTSDRLAEEAETHGDVLQGDFPESTQHLTHKTMLGLNWVARHCSHARHVLKVNHDAWVNLPLLLTYLRAHPLEPPLGLGGHCKHADRPDPPFCDGPGYVTTPDVARKIVRVSGEVPFYQRDDVYVGVCVRKLRLRVHRIPGFNIGIGDSTWITELCQLHGSRLIFRHGFTPKELQVIWKEGKCLPAKIGLPLFKRKIERERATGRSNENRRV